MFFKKGTKGKINGTILGMEFEWFVHNVAYQGLSVLKNLGNYIPDSVKNVSWLQGAKEPVKKVLAGMDTAGGKIADYAMQGYGAVKGFGEKAVETVKGWFSKGTPAA